MKFLFTALFALSFCAIPAFAQEEQESISTEESLTADASAAYLRVWVMIPPDKLPPIVGDQPELTDRLSVIYDGDDGTPQYILGRAVPFSTSGYSEMPPTPRQLRLIRKTGDQLLELASAKAEFNRGAFLTAIVQKSGGRYSLTVVDDSKKAPAPVEALEAGDAAPPPSKQIIFYNFLPNTSTVVGCEKPPFTRTVDFGTPELVSQLPGEIFNVSMPVTIGKRTYNTPVEVDLLANDSLSFLMVQDFYGRTVAKVLPNAKLE